MSQVEKWPVRDQSTPEGPRTSGGTAPPEVIVEMMIAAYEAVGNSFGLSDMESVGRQLEFERTFEHLICGYKGHDFTPDDIGKPDACWRCGKADK